MQNNEVIRHLPHLRLYARALTGSRTHGDECVRICLETLLVEPKLLTSDAATTRLELYRLFHQVWSRVAGQLNWYGNSGGAQDGLESEVSLLPLKQRQALLLTAVQGFSVEETAAILGDSAADMERLLEQTRRHLNDEIATSVLIIEDEPIVAIDIASIVAEMGHQVVGAAATKEQAIALAKARCPGIVLADIQLADGSSGIDAVAEILEVFDVPVVFVTAYPERLLTGEGREPTYLITKPFNPEALKVVIYQALLARRYRADHQTPQP